MHRDARLDRMRGFAMLWVLSVHCLYWFPLFESGAASVMKSFLLFEMPLLFFVTGASNGMHPTGRYLDFVRRRVLHVMAPYFLYASICASVSAIGLGQADGADRMVPAVVAVSWFLLFMPCMQLTHVNMLTDALWFLPVYILVILAVPVLKRAKSSHRRFLPAGFLLAGFLAVRMLEWPMPRHVAFYLLWTYAGLFYREIMDGLATARGKACSAAVFALGSCLLAALWRNGACMDMQQNKFPPDLTFLAFSATAMAAVLPMAQLLDRFADRHGGSPAVRALDALSARSATVFLFQPFAYLAAGKMLDAAKGPSGAFPDAVRWAGCMCAVVPLCVLSAKLFGWAEDIGKARALPHGKGSAVHAGGKP